MLFLVMMEVFSRMMKRVEGAGLLHGFRADDRQGGEQCVLHLLFVDDMILFCNVDVEQILHVRMLLLCFQAVTGLKVNVLKSEMILVGEVHNVHALACLCPILVCHWGLPTSPLLFGILSWRK